MSYLRRLAGIVGFLVLATAFMVSAMLFLNPVLDWLGMPRVDVLGN